MIRYRTTVALTLCNALERFMKDYELFRIAIIVAYSALKKLKIDPPSTADSLQFNHVVLIFVQAAPLTRTPTQVALLAY